MRVRVLVCGWFLWLCLLLYRGVAGWKLPFLGYLLYLPGVVFLPFVLLLLALQLYGRTRRDLALCLLMAWLALGPLLGGQANLWHSRGGRSLRIATANLRGYETDLSMAGKTLFNLDLDIVCFQEIWTQFQLDEVKKAFPGYTFCQGGGLSSPNYFVYGVFVASRLQSADGKPTSLDHAAATRLLWQGRSISAISVHGRKQRRDYSPAGLAETMKLQSQQLEALLVYLERQPDLVVLGGDFNAPDTTPLLRGLEGPLDSSFRRAGAGLGYTFPTAFPVVRIDQILATPKLQPVSCDTINVGSDHLAVVVEYRQAD